MLFRISMSIRTRQAFFQSRVSVIAMIGLFLLLWYGPVRLWLAEPEYDDGKSRYKQKTADDNG
jgi:hypothetical protein